ncbi:YadA-like family protein [Paraburkholderia sprentiae WSM5005]|uniref:YadA-like family protein n=2 Tax=Paraburkholderia sprentiae TaxID=948107 RepID=A0A1I9YFB3_9BURK|nr:YadA-like family protein [Paraburkholderia sprentiae]APA84996.2 YadA-like family protein [Paraburkholderia sprentiae WSM5005]
MNKSYVSIWSEALGSWVAASEHTARRGKRSKSHCVMGSIGVALGVIAGYSGNAAANVTNPIGAYGNIAINNATTTTAAASASTAASIAIGAGANAKGDVNYDGSSAIAIGDSAKANGGGAIALGEMAVVNGDHSAAFGPASTVSASNSVALGFGSTVTATNSVALGVNSVADRANTVSVGATTGQRQIVNLAAGTQGTDAVNLSQLGGVVNALGGGAAIKSDGTISAPSYSVGGTTVNNVGDAVANIDENVRRNASKMDDLNDGLVMIHNIARDNSNDIAINKANITNVTNNLNDGTIGLVQHDAATRNLTVAKDLDGTTVDFGGTDGVRTLNGVKAGALGDTSTEAVNGSQLYATNQNVMTNTADIAANATNVATNKTAITSIDGRVTDVEGSVTNLTQQLDGGSVGLVQQDATSKAITVARGLDGTTVDFGGTDGVRTLSGVKAGALGDTSTEAVNGSQLHATNRNVTTNTASIADNATNVATNKTAITSIEGRVTNVEGSVTNLTQQLDGGSVGLVQQDATSKAITVARGLDGTTVDFGGTDGARTLSGVAEGAIAAGSKEAVNGSQLHANSASVAAGLGGGSAVNADGTISAPSYSVGGTTVHSVGDAVTNLDDRVTENTTDITKLQNQVGDVGTQLSGAVQYDRHADGSVNFGSVTLGGSLSAGPVILSNVANGTSQYDAVNFGQLSALQDQVTDLNGQVTDLGSQVSNIQPVTPDVSSPDRNNDAVANAAMPGTGAGSTVVGANASAAAGNAVAVGTNAAATGVNSTAIGTGSQAGNANSVALGQGSMTDRDNSVSVGSAGNERQITNVAAGTADTDAVNVGQMNSSVAQGLQQANNYTDQRINATNQAINDVAKNAYAGIAAAMAMPNMTPSGPGKTIVAAGGATYKGGSAAAVGATYRSRNNKWLVNAAMSVTSTGDAGVRAQVGYEF